MTFGQLKSDLYGRMGFRASPDTDVVTRIGNFINETQREILRKKHFRRLRRRLVTMATVASDPFAALPQAAVRIFGITDRVNDYNLEEKDLLWIRSMDPSLRAVTANPWAYAIYDLASPVAKQPADASQIFVKSTSAGDAGTAFLDSVRTGGYYGIDSKVMTGVTAVGFTFTDSVALNKFYISAAAVGAVTLNEDSGAGTELARIPIGRTYARYSLVHLYPTPSAVLTYYVDIEVHLEDMVNANDEPIMPEEFHHLLGIGARKKEYEKREKMKLMAEMEKDQRMGESAMITWMNQKTGLPAPGDGARRRYSQLGPWYPAGS